MLLARVRKFNRGMDCRVKPGDDDLEDLVEAGKLKYLPGTRPSMPKTSPFRSLGEWRKLN